MRSCPACGRTYGNTANFCPDDGTALAIGSPAPAVGQLLMGQFELREPCASGSMGTVYRAWQKTMDREVAIKVMRPELADKPEVVRRFYREARAAARLAHENIVTVHVVGETLDGLPFIAMELVAGDSLGDLCDRHGPLPTARALNLTRQVASALVEAHAHDVIHRDLKPANIMVTRRGSATDVVKVLDFGIAKILYDTDQSLLTQTGTIFGTPYFLSPEQAAGTPVDMRADIYSLGVVLFQMLTGALPFSGANAMDVLLAHLKQDPPRPRSLVPTIPPLVEQIVLRALQKDRDHRWPSAAALLEALDDAAAKVASGQADDPGPPDADATLHERPPAQSTPTRGKPTTDPPTAGHRTLKPSLERPHEPAFVLAGIAHDDIHRHIEQDSDQHDDRHRRPALYRSRWAIATMAVAFLVLVSSTLLWRTRYRSVESMPPGGDNATAVAPAAKKRSHSTHRTPRRDADPDAKPVAPSTGEHPSAASRATAEASNPVANRVVARKRPATRQLPVNRRSRRRRVRRPQPPHTSSPRSSAQTTDPAPAPSVPPLGPDPIDSPPPQLTPDDSPPEQTPPAKDDPTDRLPDTPPPAVDNGDGDNQDAPVPAP